MDDARTRKIRAGSEVMAQPTIYIYKRQIPQQSRLSEAHSGLPQLSLCFTVQRDLT